MRPFFEAWFSMFEQPLWLASILLLTAFSIYISIIERSRFGTPLASVWPMVFRSWLLGGLAGFALSLLLYSFSFSIRSEEVILIWLVTLCLTALRMRWACFSHAVGLLSLLSLTAQLWEGLPFTQTTWWSVIRDFHVVDWLWLVGLAHLVEWILIRADGAERLLPVEIRHISGHSVNGYLLSNMWPFPLVLMTPAGWLPVPVMLSFASQDSSKPVRQHKRLTATWILLYALLLLLVLYLFTWYPPLVWLAVLIALLGHETLYLWVGYVEKRRDPFFISDERGLKVLVVLPETPAAAMGLKAGDIIRRLNGMPIHTLEDLEEAAKKSQFCKLEVLDEQMENHFVQRLIYEHDPKNLGIVGAHSLHR